MTRATGKSRGLRKAFVCADCGRSVHSWRGGWRHARGHEDAAPVDHPARPIPAGTYRDPEAEALRRALGRDSDGT